MNTNKKTTKELIKDPIWCGMNNHKIKTADADAVIFGIPFDEGVSFRDGANEAPAEIRRITYTSPATTEYFEDMFNVKVKDLGDIEEDDRDKLFASVEQLTCQLVKNENFFIMIGGDHSVTIPVLRGIDDALDEDFGIIHIDAHFDLGDILDGDRLSHGCTERRALELSNINDSENIFFIGIRSAEPNELEFMDNNKLNLISAYDYSQLGTKKVIKQVIDTMGKYNKVYITLDIDVLDIMGTGTPQIGGLVSRDLMNLLRGFFDLNIIGMDVVEVAPKLDQSLYSVFAARKIITESIGHHVRKNGGLSEHQAINGNYQAINTA